MRLYLGAAGRFTFPWRDSGNLAKLWKALHCLDKVLVVILTEKNNPFPHKVGLVTAIQVPMVFMLKIFILVNLYAQPRPHTLQNCGPSEFIIKETTGIHFIQLTLKISGTGKRCVYVCVASFLRPQLIVKKNF